MSGVRDSQRSRLYRAEGVQPRTPQLSTLAECDEWLDRLITRRAFRNRWGGIVDSVPRLHDGRGRRHAAGSASGMWLPRWARRPDLLMHELAHVIVCRIGQSTGSAHAAHGWLFAQTLLEMTRIAFGAEQARLLRASYRVEAVRHRSPRPKREGRSMTEIEKAEWVARMAAAKAAKAAGKERQ